ncbi:suppressor APC domain-containing protein 2-like isoform X2 [Lissotriton helveticus]
MTAVTLSPKREDLNPGRRTSPMSRAFVRSLRTLFNILDDQRTGSVHLSEIESRWGRRGGNEWPQAKEGGGDALLLPVVLDSLRQVAAPCGGYLSFPRLVAGLRIALLHDEERGGQACSPSCPPHIQESDRWMEKREVGVHHKTASPHRAADGKGVSRSQSINSTLAPGSRWKSRHVLNEPRRHSITNGIDYETDFLADHYSNYGCVLLARIQEVNLSLNNLFSSPGQVEDPSHHPLVNGFSSSASPGTRVHPETLGALWERNHMLMKEVTEKSERIAQLEMEKAALCKQLQEKRAYRPSSHKGATFI